MFTAQAHKKIDKMESTSVRESGYVTDSEEIDKQFLADLEKAKALSMETAALEKFRHMAPAATSNTGDNSTRSRITQSNSCSTIDQGNGEKGNILSIVHTTYWC